VRVDVVREREQRLLIGVVPLEGDLDLADVARALEVDDLGVQRLARALAVQVFDEVDDAAVVLEGRLEALAPLVAEVDLQALREEGHLAEALLEHRAVVVDRLEDLEVRQEADARAAAVRLGALLEVAGRLAALVRLGVLVAVAPDGQVEPLGEGVDDGDADAVEAAGHLVAAAVAELAAGVEDGQHDLRRGALLLLHRVDRDTSPVVGDRDGVVRVDDDLDLVGLAGEGLVHGVVDHLVDQVVESTGAGRADVHARPLPDGLEPLEDGDVLGVVAAVARVLLLVRQPAPSVVEAAGAASIVMKRPRPRGSAAHGPGRYIRPPLILAAYPPNRTVRSATKSPQIASKCGFFVTVSAPNRRRSAAARLAPPPRPRSGPPKGSR
jgi:hypothetical protein